MFVDPAPKPAPGQPQVEAIALVPQGDGPTMPGVLGAVGLVAAAAMFVVGFALFSRVRRSMRAQVAGNTVGAISDATRTIMAFSAMILGYHLCAWSLGDQWLPLRVPVARWWVVPGLAIAAIAASAGVDMVQRQFDRESAPK